MKIYIAHYDNGESYEDNNHWYSDYAHHTKEACEKEILDKGFIVDEETPSLNGEKYKTVYKREDGDKYYVDCEYAEIDEIELTE